MMAAAALEQSVSLSDVQNDIEYEKRTVFGWIFDYCCLVFWEEFKENFTIDATSERRLLEGIPMYQVDSIPARRRLAHFAVLLTRLADGSNPDTEYNSADDETSTPLEEALKLFEELMNMIENEGELDEDADSIKMAIKLQAVLVCCRVGDYATASDVFERLWEDKDITKAEQQIKTTLEKVLRTKSLKSVSCEMSWKSFQDRTVCFLQQVYGRMETPFLHHAVQKFIVLRSNKLSKACKRKSTPNTSADSVDEKVCGSTGSKRVGRRHRRRLKSPASSCTEENGDAEATQLDEGRRVMEGNRTSHRVMPYAVLIAAGKELDGNDLADEQWNPTEAMEKISQVKQLSNLRKSRQSTASAREPPCTEARKESSPSSLAHTNSASNSKQKKKGKTTVVQFTPRKRPHTRNYHSEESASPEKTPVKKSPVKKSSRPAVSPIVYSEEETQDLTESDSPVTSTPHHDVRDAPSTSTATESANKRNINNKENNIPKRGRGIREQRYQPRRVLPNTRTINRNSNSNKNYIDWSSDSSDSDSPNDIFKLKLSPRKCRRSLELETVQVPQKWRRPAQRVPWTLEDEKKLRKGVEKYGKGNWALIKNECGFILRTSVNLKDKWRNMEKVV